MNGCTRCCTLKSFGGICRGGERILLFFLECYIEVMELRTS